MILWRGLCRDTAQGSGDWDLGQVPADLMSLASPQDSKEILEVYRSLGHRVVGLVGAGSLKTMGGLVIVPRRIVLSIDLFRPGSRFLEGIKPMSKDHARRACRARTASTIVFDEQNIDLCDEEHAEVSGGSSVATEILMRPLLSSGEGFWRFLSRARRCAELVSKRGGDLLLSSGSRRPEEIWAPSSVGILVSLILRNPAPLLGSWAEVLRRWKPGLSF